MKTWRQLEAMAKRQGLTIRHGLRTCALFDKHRAQRFYCDVWIGRPGFVLRAACEATLREMGRKR